MPYWSLYYHAVWATQERRPLISPEIEPVLYRLLSAKVDEQRGVAFAINGTADHVHLIASVPPSVALSDFVKRLKGSASYIISAEFDIPFRWQEGYGIFSISRQNLKRAIAYVECQKQHHEAATTIPAFERTESTDRDHPASAGR